MLNAAKSDGSFDADEQKKVLSKLGDLSKSEADFIKEELAKPLDIDGFVREVPKGLEQQAYAFSVMGIKLGHPGRGQLPRQARPGPRTPRLRVQRHKQAARRTRDLRIDRAAQSHRAPVRIPRERRGFFCAQHRPRPTLQGGQGDSVSNLRDGTFPSGNRLSGRDAWP